MRYTLFVIDATLALSVLIIQCLTYISLLGTNERAELKLSYILLRIVAPTALDFFLLFEDSMQTPVHHLVDGIRSAFENERFEFAPDLSFTLSAGIAEYKDEYNEKMWLDVADKAMYYSKEHGRNQIHVAE